MSKSGLDYLTQAAERFNGFAETALPLPLTPGTPLANQGGALDSLALMNFIMEIEIVLEEAGYAVNLTDGRALATFGTAGDLAVYLEGLL